MKNISLRYERKILDPHGGHYQLGMQTYLEDGENADERATWVRSVVDGHVIQSLEAGGAQAELRALKELRDEVEALFGNDGIGLQKFIDARLPLTPEMTKEQLLTTRSWLRARAEVGANKKAVLDASAPAQLTEHETLEHDPA